jgi:hypothetical protein
VEMAHQLWEEAIQDAFDFLVAPVIPNAEFPTHVFKELISVGRPPDSERDGLKRICPNVLEPTWSKGHAAPQIRNALDALSPATHEQRRAIYSWFANLGAIEANLFRDTPAVIFVRDEAFLRDFIQRDSPIDMLKERTRQYGETYSDMELSRWEEYRDVTLSHIRTSLRDHRFFASTAEKLGLVPEIHATLMRQPST